MPSALARADHPRPNIFRKDRYSIGSVALVVELFSRAEIRISVQLDIINISKLMMPSQGEMRRKAICSNMQESRGHHERGSLANIRKRIFGYPSISQKPTKDPLSLSSLPRIGKPAPERLHA
ncbi:unnamed protein product [Sphagnum balticum]